MKRVLFVCAGNTCRSVMAEYIANRRFQQHVNAESAGLQPGTAIDSEDALYTLGQVGIDAKDHRPRDVREINLLDFDTVVAMDASVARQFRVLFPNWPLERMVSTPIEF